jgi:hypothetical protein
MGLMNNELERMWKEATVIQTDTLSWHKPVQTEEHYKEYHSG